MKIRVSQHESAGLVSRVASRIHLNPLKTNQHLMIGKPDSGDYLICSMVLSSQPFRSQ